ncbi:hypothetical protein HPS36_05170 [Halorubrum salinarum]|uniref:Uncharacterized protein n=1 Tax=Halorubrum salinarum TaxID=2739057 RepID=A0A7D4D389_9EURY|nr:hypothetical protein [Halorubrum salinarum]QKG92262.1 hypothetical protein HPS36_05170 [Halorubrum salinarum]
MDRRDARFVLLSTLLAVTLINTLAPTQTAEWFRSASFLLAFGALLYAAYVVVQPVLAWLPAR